MRFRQLYSKEEEIVYYKSQNQGPDVEPTAEAAEPTAVPDEGTDALQTTDVPNDYTAESVEPATIPDERSTEAAETTDLPGDYTAESVEPATIPDERSTEAAETTDLPDETIHAAGAQIKTLPEHNTAEDTDAGPADLKEKKQKQADNVIDLPIGIGLDKLFQIYIKRK